MRKRLLAVGVAGLGLFLAGLLMAQNVGDRAKTEAPSAAARLAAVERVCGMFHDEKTGAPRAHADHYLWSMRWMDAQRDVARTKVERTAAAEAHLERMRKFHKDMAELAKSNVVSQFELAATEYYVVEAEELLARAKAE